MQTDSKSFEGTDNRKETRERWSLEPQGRMQLHSIVFGSLPILSFRDVSSQGASVLVPGAMQTGEQVTIQLDSGGATLNFLAVVAWCKAEPPSSAETQKASPDQLHAIGLNLRGPYSFATMLSAYREQP
jgi:hypothetical protein